MDSCFKGILLKIFRVKISTRDAYEITSEHLKTSNAQTQLPEIPISPIWAGTQGLVLLRGFRVHWMDSQDWEPWVWGRSRMHGKESIWRGGHWRRRRGLGQLPAVWTSARKVGNRFLQCLCSIFSCVLCGSAPPSSSDKERPHYFSRAVDSTPHLFHVLLRKVCLSSGRHILLARRVTIGRRTLFKYSSCG